MVDRAMELSPDLPGWFYFPASHIAYRDGDFRKGLALAHKTDMPGYFWYHIWLALHYTQLGQADEAQRQVNLVRETYPEFERVAYSESRKWWWEEDEIEALIAGLREAGMDIPSESAAK